MKKVLLMVSLWALSIVSFAQLSVVYKENFETLPYKISADPSWKRNDTIFSEGTHSFFTKLPGNGSVTTLYTDRFETKGKATVHLHFSQIAKIGLATKANVRVKVITLKGATRTTTYLDATQYTQYNGWGSGSGSGVLQNLASDATPVSGYDKTKTGFNFSSYTEWGGAANYISNTWWKQETFDLSAIAQDKDSVQIAFEVYDGNGGSVPTYAGMFLDNIVVEVAPCDMIAPYLAWMGETTTVNPSGAIGTTSDNPSSRTIRVSTADTSYGLAGSGLIGDSVRIEYTVDNSPSIFIVMEKKVGPERYENSIPFYGYGRIIKYRAISVDSSCTPNRSVTPWKSYWMNYTDTSATGGLNGETGQLISITSPSGTVSTNPPLKVLLRNDSKSTPISSVSYTYTLDNGSLQRNKYILSPSVNPKDTVEITLAPSISLHSKNNAIKVWIDSINGVPDKNTKGDTISITVYKCSGISSSVTLGSSEFPNFDEFFYAVKQCSLSTPTTLLLPPGTYDSIKISIDDLAGITAANNLTIRASSPGTVVIKSIGDYAFRLNNTSNVTFKDIIFVDSLSTTSRVIHITGNSSNIGIENCTFYGKRWTSTAYNATTQVSIYGGGVGTNLKNIKIKGNTFINGARIISLAGTSANYLESITIENNTAINVHSFADLQNVKNVNVGQNTVNTFSISHGNAIFNISYFSAINIVGNKVSNSNTSSIPLFNFSAGHDTIGRNLIANNIGLFQGNTNYNAFIYSNSNGTDIVYNYFNSTNTYSSNFNYLVSFSGSYPNTRFYNNILSNVGERILLSKGVNNLDANYNAYYSIKEGTGNLFNNNSTYYKTLDQWKALGFDTNSVSLQNNPYDNNFALIPQYQEPLRDRALPIPAVTKDYNNITRSTIYPTIGAMEVAPVANDIAAVSIVPFTDSCGLTLETITINAKNMGTNPITSFKAKLYKGNAQVGNEETITLSIASKQIKSFPFPTKVDLSSTVPGKDDTNTIRVVLSLTGDGIPYNDTVTQKIVTKYKPLKPVITDPTALNILFGKSTTLTVDQPANCTTYWWPSEKPNKVDTSALINDKTYKTPVLSVTTYYDVRYKNTANGCYGDFQTVRVVVGNPPTYNVGLISMIGNYTFCKTETPVYKVTLRNSGATALDSLRIYYTLGDSVYAPYIKKYPAKLAIDAVDTVTLPAIPSLASGILPLKIWVASPNGHQDEYADDDTLTAVVKVRFEGNILVGSGEHYTDLQALFTELSTAGVCKPVTISLNDVFTGGFFLDSIPNSSLANTITIKSTGGYIKSADDDTSSITVRASYVTFDGIIFDNSGKSSKTRALLFTPGVSDVKIANCTFKGTTPGGTLLLADVLVHFTGKTSNVIIEKNTFVNGHYAIYLYSKDTTAANVGMNNIIRYNTVDRSGVFLHLEGQKNTKVLHNTVNTVSSSKAAIYMTRVVGTFSIMSNNIVSSGNEAFYAEYVKATGGRGYIANNIFKTLKTNLVEVRGLDSTDFVFNYLHSTDSLDVVMMFNDRAWGNGWTFRNNVVSANYGRLMNVSGVAKPAKVTNNAYYYGNSPLPFRYGTNNCATLADWKTKAGAGIDTLSIVLPTAPFDKYMEVDMGIFMDNLFKKAAAISGITTDYNDSIRPTPPSIGAIDLIQLNKDIAMDVFLHPVNGTERPESYQDSVIVRIRNLGVAAIPPPMTVRYYLNDVLQQTKSFTGTIGTGSSATALVSFTAPSERYTIPPGPYTLRAEVILSGDQRPQNNTKTINVYGRPKNDAGIIAIREIASGCNIQEDSVSITIKNFGADPIYSETMTAFYDPGDGTGLVSEPVKLLQPILSDSVYVYTFAKKLQTLATTNDIKFRIHAWVTLNGGIDKIHTNDSSKVVAFTSRTTPPLPVISDVEIAQGTFTTLTVPSTLNVNWYKSNLPTASIISKGKTYKTGYVYADSTFYVALHNGGCEGPRKRVLVSTFRKQVDVALLEKLEPEDYVGGFVISPEIKLLVRNVGYQPVNSIKLTIEYKGVQKDVAVSNSTLEGGFKDTTMTSKDFVIDHGWNYFKAWITVPGDQNHDDDTLHFKIFKNVLIQSLPYEMNFDADNLGWYTVAQGQEESEWEYGKPNKDIIDKAHTPENAWVTDLNMNYTKGVVSYLYSPMFDMSKFTPDKITFWNNRQLVSTSSRAYIEYVDFTGKWVKLGSINDVKGKNWYNASQGYTNNTNVWENAKYNFKGLNLALDFLQFRFVFSAGSGDSVAEGWAIDDFVLTKAIDSVDVGITSIAFAKDSLAIGDIIAPTIKLTNYGLKAHTSIPLLLIVNGKVVAQDKWEGSLTYGQTSDPYTIKSTYQADTNKILDICVSIVVPDDRQPDNNTICKRMATHPADLDVAAIAITSPTGRCQIATPNIVGVLIKNVGRTTAYSISVNYSLGGQRISDPKTVGPLASGDTMTVYFGTDGKTTGFNGVFGFQKLTAFVVLMGDNYRKNDTVTLKVQGETDIETVAANGMTLEQNYPNPAFNSTTIQYSLPYSGTARFVIVNALGRVVYNMEKRLEAGDYSIELSKQDIPSGIYYYFLEFDGHRLTKKMIFR